jgi:hypothetical protein
VDGRKPCCTAFSTIREPIRLNGSLIFDSAGNIYGTTLGDLTAAVGSVFEITP